MVLDDAAKKETKGDHQKGILAFLRCIQSRPHFFAEQLNKAIRVCQDHFLYAQEKRRRFIEIARVWVQKNPC